MTGAAATHPLSGQGPRGVGPDARTTPGGTLRIGFGALWDRNAETYDSGRLRELGARYSFDSLGAGVFAGLAAGQAATRIVTGMPDFSATLGTAAVHARRAVQSTPVYAELGITSHLAVGVVVPFVTSAVRIDASVNPRGRGANVGLNPALTSESVAANTAALLGQINAAGTFVAQQIAACAASPGMTGCAAYAASPGTARQLVAESARFASAIATLYGTTGQAGLPFVPLAGSAAQSAVAARLAGFKAQFSAFGAPAIPATAPTGAPAPITGTQFQGILTDPAYGVASTGLVPVTRRGIGNVEASVQYTLHDSYGPSTDGAAARGALWWRAAVGGAYHAAAPRASSAADLIPVDVGDPAAAYEGRGAGEVGVGRTFSLAAAVSMTTHATTETAIRVPASATDVFPGPDREVRVSYTPGSDISATFAPRWTPNDAIGLAAIYTVRAKSADRYAFRESTSSGAPPDPSVLSGAASDREHRLGASIAYSTVASWKAGRARWPVEIVLSHFQTTTASGSAVPKLARDDVTVRWYWRPFGRSRR